MAVIGAHRVLLSQSCPRCASADANGWFRPANWPAMPATAANKIDILAAVISAGSNYVALAATITGGYTVDWGDGTIDTWSSAAVAQHTYNYSTLGSAVIAFGDKTALIKITSTSGSNSFTALQLGSQNTRPNLNVYTQPWLDVQINAASLTSIGMSGTVPSRLVQRINIVAIGAIATLANAFQSCFSLQSVTFPAGSLASVTNLTNTFQGCYSLQSVTFPAGSLASVIILTSTFQNCNTLQSVTFPAGSLASVTNLTNTFLSCYSLQSVTFPAGSLASVTNLTSTFQNCSSLQSVTFPAGWAPSSLTTTPLAFSADGSLAAIVNCAIPVSFSVAACKLDGVALNAIFTALPTVVGQTITITGNHGVPDCTTSIATAKGWTVTT